MRIVVVASRKGGSGKSSLTAHLAVAAEKSGHGPCVLIDTDPQGSLALWWNDRATETPAFAQLLTLGELSSKLQELAQAGFRYAFIDTPPAITESIKAVIDLADFVLIPVRPSPHDLRAVGDTVNLVQQAQCPFAFVVNAAKPNTRLTVQTVAALSAHGMVAPSIVHDRVDFAASMIDGRTVLETSAKSPGAQEINSLWAFVKSRKIVRTNER